MSNRGRPCRFKSRECYAPVGDLSNLTEDEDWNSMWKKIVDLEAKLKKKALIIEGLEETLSVSYQRYKKKSITLSATQRTLEATTKMLDNALKKEA